MNLRKKIRGFFTLTRKADGGFTLVELIVVIAILAILAGTAVPAYTGYINKANEAADQQLLAALNTAYASACMEKGEYDMTNLSFGPTADIKSDGSVTMNKFNTEFQNYFGGGLFKYFDALGFDKAEGVFVGNTVANLMTMMKEAMKASNISDAGAMEIVSKAFDMFSNYFSGNNDVFEGGFSIDGFIAQMPQEVQDAFRFGNNDVTPDQLDELLMEYGEGYAEAEDKEQWIKDNQELVNTIKGNAYVMNLASAAGSGVTAEGIKEDIVSLMGAISTASEMSDEDLWAMFKENNPNSTYTSLDELKTACYDESLENYGLTSDMLVYVAASGVKNESGINTLCSMYAIAAGYLNSDEYQTAVNGGADSLGNSIGSFPEVLAVMNHGGFSEYFNGTTADDGTTTPGDALNDIDAYLSYMNYVSANGVDMKSDSAFETMGETVLGILAGN